MSVKYQNPPINEVIIGVFFKDPIPALRSEHIGIYWAKIRDEFPGSAQRMTIGNPALQMMQLPDEIFPMPRFWFTSKDKTYLIQVQRDGFIFNWRRHDKNNYPHYEVCKENFDTHLKGFEEFCREEFGLEKLAIARCELTYINVISGEDYFQSFDDVNKVVPSFSAPTSALIGNPLREFTETYSYTDDEDSLIVSLQSRRQVGTNNDALYFELKSDGLLSKHEKEDADAWFDSAHERSCHVFNEMTSSEIQKQYWQPKES